MLAVAGLKQRMSSLTAVGHRGGRIKLSSVDNLELLSKVIVSCKPVVGDNIALHISPSALETPL